MRSHTWEVPSEAEGWCTRISGKVTSRGDVSHNAVTIATHIQTIDHHRWCRAWPTTHWPTVTILSGIDHIGRSTLSVVYWQAHICHVLRHLLHQGDVGCGNSCICMLVRTVLPGQQQANILHLLRILMLTDPTRGESVALAPALHSTISPWSALSVTVTSTVELTVVPELSLIMVIVNGAHWGADPSWTTRQSDTPGSSQRVKTSTSSNVMNASDGDGISWARCQYSIGGLRSRRQVTNSICKRY